MCLNSLMNANAIAGQCNEYISVKLPISIFLCLSINNNISVDQFLYNGTIPHIINSIGVCLVLKSIEKQFNYVRAPEHCLQAWNNWDILKMIAGLLSPIIPQLIA